MRSHARRGTRGLTLIELMVVVAIVAIVLTIGARATWRRGDGAAWARATQAAALAARRDAIAIGVQRFDMSPDTTDPRHGDPRASCMPNTALVVQRDRIDQINCALDRTRPANTFPCDAASDDCTWTTGAVRSYAPARGWEVATVRRCPELPAVGACSSFAPPEATSRQVQVYFRPDGSTDVTLDGGVTGLGGANERVEIFLRRAGTTAATCQGESDRCFVVRADSLQSRVATKWPVL